MKLNQFNRYFGFLAWQILGNLFHFLGRLAGLNFLIHLLNVSAKYQLQEGIFADDLHKKSKWLKFIQPNKNGPFMQEKELGNTRTDIFNS